MLSIQRLLSFFLLLFSAPVFGYPEMVRHGYANCTACHISPNGGGVLTPYGRVLSREAMSTWGRENEENFLYNVVKTPEWLLPGGDVRLLQMHMENSMVEVGRFIVMQADLEAAVNVDKFTASASFGWKETAATEQFKDGFLSRQHYLMYRPADKWSIRAGRFFHAYGLNIADHTTSIKRGLGWDQSSETYNVEGAYLGDDYNLHVTGILGRLDKPSLDREKGVSIRGTRNVGDSYKFGASYFFGTNDKGRRHVFGPYGIVGITKRFFILGEIDFQSRYSPTAPSTFGVLNYLRVDYEVLQGLHVYATQEYSRSDLKDPGSLADAYGLGIQFFPRPHVEWVATWQKARVMAQKDEFADVLALMFHYYL